jgi:ribonuclease P protein component
MNAALPRRHTFRKAERLNGRKAIEQLVASGRNIVIAPFRLLWIPIVLPTDFPAQIAFSVPKRNFKKAVDRNRMKRLMRESYRKNKSDIYTLLAERKLQCALLLNYSGKTQISFVEADEKIKQILQRFAKDLQSHS